MVITSEVLRNIRKTGRTAEKRAVNWLERDRGFEVTYWHRGKPSNKPYDIRALKEGEEWIFEVKGGDTGQISLKNLEAMYKECVNRIGLIFVPNQRRVPFLFELRKMTHARHLAGATMGPRRRTLASQKARSKNVKRQIKHLRFNRA